MIISHAYKYAFLTTRKTGSTSCALYLLQNLFEKGDISLRDFRPHYEHPEVIKPSREHMTDGESSHWGMQYLVENSGINLSEYRVFAVLRNPYDRIISRAFHMKNFLNCHNLFDARRILAKGYADENDRDRPQSSFFIYKGQLKAEVWDYNNINTLFPEFVMSYGKEPKYPLQYLKNELTPSWATTDIIFTPAIRQKITEVFADDIKLYNTYCSQDRLE